YERDDSVRLEAELGRRSPLCLEQRTEFGCEGEHSTVAILRGAGLEPNGFSREVHLSPGEAKDLRHSPPGDVTEYRDWTDRLRKLLLDRIELVALKEALPRTALLERRNVRPRQDLAPLATERECPLERGQLAVDRGITRRIALAL